MNRRKLQASDLEDVMTDRVRYERPVGTPTVYDLVEMLERMKRAEPVRARFLIRDLRWLCCTVSKHGINWQTPWTDGSQSPKG
jgi:hypothetical protein